MNRIDITKTQHHYHCNNNVVVVTKRDGIQGPPGEEGITPHIDPETFHWFIGDVDTGIYAGMSNTDDITLLYLFDNRESFPSVGNVKDLYLDTETSTIYRWNAFSSTFVMFKADYVKELERAIVEAQTKLNNLEEEALKKPRVIVPGSLILAQGDGTVKCSDITYEELLEKIDEGGKVDFPTNLTPDALLVGSESGGIESSEISRSELISVIENSKNNVKYRGTIVPGSLVLSTEDGKIESSDITHSELLAVIESTKNCVKFDGDIIHNSLVLADKSGNIKSSDKTFNQLIEELKNSGVQADWNETNIDSPAFIKNKPDVVEKTEYDSLVEVVKKKSGFLSTPITGNLVTSDSSGNLYSTTLNVNNVVTADTIVAGSFSDYVIIEEDLVKTVTIPESVMQYITIDVYHNGKLLVPEIHYLWEADDYIDLVGFTANRDDIFSFVGHGVTTTMTPFAGGGIGGCDHSHMNLEVLDGITQEKVDSWDSSTKIFSENGTIISTYLPVATQDTLGAVKSSDGINNVRISDEGIMSVNSIDVSTLVSIDDGVYGGEDYSVVLSSGSSFSYKE